MKVTATLVTVAAAASMAAAQDSPVQRSTENVEPRLLGWFSDSWGYSTGSWAKSWWSNGSAYRTKNQAMQPLSWSVSFGSSSCGRSNYGASGKPWNSWSQPGWYIGSGSVNGVAKWDQGDYRWCSSSRYSKNSFCKNGNGVGQAPASKPQCWGVQGGQGNYPRPRPHQGGSGSGSSSGSGSTASQGTSSAATSTVTSVVPTSTVQTTVVDGVTTTSTSVGSSTMTTVITDAATATAVPTAGSSTSSTDGASTTSSSAPVIPTGPVQNGVCNNNYQLTFANYTTVAETGVYQGQVVGAAIIAGTYMTYGLAKTPQDCLTVCDQTAGCVFVNTFLDNEDDERDEPRHSGLYTCSLYSACEDITKATNYGGQQDPTYITESNGYCKSAACQSISI